MPKKKAKEDEKKATTKTWLNLREKPEGDIKKILKPGETVIYKTMKLENNRLWVGVKVEATGEEGFVMADYLEEGV